MPSSSEPPQILFPPGTLWESVTRRTATALASGALQHIPTDYEVVEQQGITFLVRIVNNLARKPLPPPAALKSEPSVSGSQVEPKLGPARNPFLPHEPELFVADVSPTHLCLLNKFNVVDHHLLLITRAFEAQSSRLNPQDFAALWACMGEQNWLAFYNGGAIAGASQPHKHLQLVPLPLVPGGEGVPIASLLPVAIWEQEWARLPVPFVHLLTRLEPGWSFAEAGQQLTHRYNQMLNLLTLQLPIPEVNQPGFLPPYNLLLTREWMLLVLRSRSEYAQIPVNALGFAGAFLVRDQQQRQQLLEIQPLSLLQQVGVSYFQANQIKKHL